MIDQINKEQEIKMSKSLWQKVMLNPSAPFCQRFRLAYLDKYINLRSCFPTKECHLGHDIFVVLQRNTITCLLVVCVNKICLNIYINNMNFVGWVIETLSNKSYSIQSLKAHSKLKGHIGMDIFLYSNFQKVNPRSTRCLHAHMQSCSPFALAIIQVT